MSREWDPRPRIVIGAGPEQRLPALVCEYSIRKHASISPTIFHTFGQELPRSKKKMGTPFSFVRFWLPDLVGPEDPAIYLDSDMVLLSDISELWSLGERELSRDVPVLRTSDPSVLVVDTKYCGWNVRQLIQLIDQDEGLYSKVFGGLAGANSGPIPEEWNSHDRVSEGTKLLHYTNLDRQPWVKADHPFGWIWYQLLEEALDRGSILKEDLTKEVRELEKTEAYKQRGEVPA